MSQHCSDGQAAAWTTRVRVLSPSVASGGKNVVQLNTSGLTHALENCSVLAEEQTGSRYLWCGVGFEVGTVVFYREASCDIHNATGPLLGGE